MMLFGILAIAVGGTILAIFMSALGVNGLGDLIGWHED